MAGAQLIEYKENQRPPLRTLAFIYFLLGSLVIAIWAALPAPAPLIAFIASLILLALSAKSLTSQITVGNGVLSVGKARIETSYIRKVTTLSKEEMALERTTRINPAAHLALKFWVNTGVKITLNDSRDPTPYWLVSTKNGEKLANAIGAKS
jgi:hypothetical protein